MFDWTSSDPSVATVTDRGLVTPLRGGATDIAATYRGVTGTLRLGVVATPPSPSADYTLSGTVRENSPVGKPVADARIEIREEANSGRFAVSDGNGKYSLQALTPGRLTLSVTRSGYRELRREVELSGNLTLRCHSGHAVE